MVFHECVLSAPTCLSGLCYYRAFIVVIFGSRKWFLTARSFQSWVPFMCVRVSMHARVITCHISVTCAVNLRLSSGCIYTCWDNWAVFLDSRRWCLFAEHCWTRSAQWPRIDVPHVWMKKANNLYKNPCEVKHKLKLVASQHRSPSLIFFFFSFNISFSAFFFFLNQCHIQVRTFLIFLCFQVCRFYRSPAHQCWYIVSLA